MGGKEKEGRVGGRGKGGEGKGEKMWRDPESGLPRGPCWLSAGLLFDVTLLLLLESKELVLEHSLSVGRAAVLETGSLPPQDNRSGTVCRPISDYVSCHTASSGSYITEDVFIRTVTNATAQCAIFNCAE